MRKPHSKRLPRTFAATVGVLALVAAGSAAQSSVAATQGGGPAFGRHVVLATGLDNPRQLTYLASGDFLIAEAGHGNYDSHFCSGSGQDAICIGKTGMVTRLHNGNANHVMTGLLSGAGPDGSFATGPDGASFLPGRHYLAIMTGGDADQVPPGLPSWQLGKLIEKTPAGAIHPIADISAFERNHDPDGEGYDSNPYAVLQLDQQTLVADAAGDYIASVSRDRHVRLWAVLPEYGKKYDAVPTVLTKGPFGKIYVGELHSEVPNAAHVWQYDRMGNRERGWGGFTTVTGVARGADGSLYVSELFGGPCAQAEIPQCLPGRVTKVAPDGTRTHELVPFPAGIAVHQGRVYVNAFSIAPATGFAGNPNWSGQLWQVFP
jgi:hypothetical protein